MQNKQTNQTNWVRTLDVLKCLNCSSKDEWYKALEVDLWCCKDEFESIWDTYKRGGLFMALCMLDQDNLTKLMWYVENKYLREYVENKYHRD